jgi:hypothetical protein
VRVEGSPAALQRAVLVGPEGGPQDTPQGGNAPRQPHDFLVFVDRRRERGARSLATPKRQIRNERWHQH